MPDNGHMGGHVQFGPDGMLYMAIGDSGGSGKKSINGLQACLRSACPGRGTARQPTGAAPVDDRSGDLGRGGMAG